MTKAWFLLFRPWSYVATLVPFLLAAGLAVASGSGCDCRWGRWALGFVSGLLFQATVNLLNTWGDERSGVDDVPGAIRTTPQVHDGLVSMRALLAAALTCAALAAGLGLTLCPYRDASGWHVDVTLLLAGFIGFLGATNYSTGFKFKYRGLGVPFVSFLMGPLEVLVALCLLLPTPPPASHLLAFLHPVYLAIALFVTLPIAALVGVVMHGNDMRDIATDRAAGIVTLASRLGPRWALVYYRLCHTLPYAITCCWGTLLGCLQCCSAAEADWRFAWTLLPLLALPLSIRTMRTATRVYRAEPGNPPWRRLERASGGVLLIYGVLYSLSFALAFAR